MEKPIDLYALGTRMMDEDPEGAISLLSRAIELAPTMVAALYNRACAYGRIGKASEVLKDIQNLERLEPELAAELRSRFRSSAIPTVEIAYSLWKEGDTKSALIQFEIAATYDPECTEAKDAIAKLRE
jgi:tetratricopeptide (TPR) repeat protein